MNLLKVLSNISEILCSLNDLIPRNLSGLKMSTSKPNKGLLGCLKQLLLEKEQECEKEPMQEANPLPKILVNHNMLK